MKTIGVLSTALAAGIVAAAVVIGLRSTPDVKRYLNMRRM